ncbi:MAG: hypothetical protein ACPG1A_11790 [Halioglobus sp.]
MALTGCAQVHYGYPAEDQFPEQVAQAIAEFEAVEGPVSKKCKKRAGDTHVAYGNKGELNGRHQCFSDGCVNGCLNPYYLPWTIWIAEEFPDHEGIVVHELKHSLFGCMNFRDYSMSRRERWDYGHCSDTWDRDVWPECQED